MNFSTLKLYSIRLWFILIPQHSGTIFDCLSLPLSCILLITYSQVNVTDRQEHSNIQGQEDHSSHGIMIIVQKIIVYMRKLLYSRIFQTSNWKQSILVHDGSLIDSIINDVPEQCLDTDVSPLLNLKYLSPCDENEEKIKKKLEYRGAIVGALNRLFVSIPVAYPQLNKFVNIHFLINTGSPYTTLTQRALCAIHQRSFSTEIQFTRHIYQIGMCPVHIHLSNSNTQGLESFTSFHNINLLGMDFFRYFQRLNFDMDFKNHKFDLRIVK